MNVKVMKAMDWWVGVPACALLSVCRGLRSLFTRPAHTDVFRRVLFIELSEMGSMVTACPALRAAAELGPDTEVYFLTFASNRAALDMLRVVPPDRVLTLNDRGLLPLALSTLRTLGALRRLDLDAAIDLELFSRVSAILSFLSGARWRAGFHRYHMEGLYRGHLLTHPVAYNAYRHISVNFMALVRALTAGTPERPLLKARIGGEFEAPRLAADPEARRRLRERLMAMNPEVAQADKIVILNPNAGALLPIRAWPLDRYIELTRRLLKRERLFVILMGTPDAAADGERIGRELSDPRVLDLIGKTRFDDLHPLFELGDLLITNDSGPAHFASITPIRIMVFFGPETPVLYRPMTDRCVALFAHYHCSPCLTAYNHRTTGCDNSRCLQAITVDEVEERALACLAAS